jgi:hypothetical protein
MLVNYGVFSLILMVCTQINMGPFFERFLILAGPEGLGKKNFKRWTQRMPWIENLDDVV